MREFTDPFTGETLDDPTRKTYEVTYTVDGFEKTTRINTLAENRPTKEQAKKKITGPAQIMLPRGEIKIKSIRKVEEVDRAGSKTFPWEP